MLKRDQASFVKYLFSRMSDDACARATSLSRWETPLLRSSHAELTEPPKSNKSQTQRSLVPVSHSCKIRLV